MNTATCFRAALALAAMLAAAPSPAQVSYPLRPVRILIPFPAGGAADTIGRTVGEQLAAQMGQPVVIDNRPGAGGRLATELVAKAEPDGYTLLVGTVGGIAISPALYQKLPFDADKDLLSLTRVAEIINVMVVHPASGARTVKEFVEWAKKRPGDVRYGSSGTGQTDHIAGESFQRLVGLRMTHVPYKGGGPALVDLIAGDLQLMFATYVVALPHVNTGRLRALAVITPQRQPLLPDLPTVGESVPGFGMSNWNGMFAPGRTPRPVADRLFTEINKALLAQEVKRRQNAAGIEPQGSRSREEFTQYVRDETKRWGRIVKDAGIRLD